MNISPDGIRYWAMAGGERVCRPFHLRWLVPAIAGQNPAAWVLWTWVFAGMAACGTAALALTNEASGAQAGVAGLLFLGLPSVRFALSRPVLVDMPTAAFAVWAAVAFEAHPHAGIVLALLAGCVNERAPIFAALFAWNPLLLAGLLPVAVRWFQRQGPDPVQDKTCREVVEHPFLAGRSFHRNQWRNPLVMVLPWGGCLLALANVDWQVAVVLAVAYAQLLVATDSGRLYQQAAPLVCVTAVTVCPPALLPALVVAHWFNPWAGNGV